MKMIIDFIKSWFYYPKMMKWLEEYNCKVFAYNRFQYAVKHYRMKKRYEEAKKNNDFSEWTCKFQQEPICKE